MLWFTGLSGSGKSTIATRVHQELERRGVEVEYIDGDALREVFPNTGFTREEREEHLRRTGYMASRLAAHGVTVVASFVSPYRASREFIRRLCPEFSRSSWRRRSTSASGGTSKGCMPAPGAGKSATSRASTTRTSRPNIPS